MAAVFDQDSLAKSGRVLILLSATLILLRQCANSFEKISLLGLELAMSNSQLDLLIRVGIFYSFAIFVIRVITSNPFLQWGKISEKADKDRSDMLVVVKAQRSKKTQKIDSEFAALYAKAKRDNEETARLKGLEEKHMEKAALWGQRRNRFFGKYYAATAYVGISVHTFTSYFLPLAFLIVALFRIKVVEVCERKSTTVHEFSTLISKLQGVLSALF